MFFMQKNFISFVLLAFSLTVNAQNFTVSGNVINQNDVPVDFADVLLFAGNTLVQNAMTDEQGKFTVSAPDSNYNLLIRQLGDTLFLQNIILDKNIDLGTIKVMQIKQLQEVLVVGKTPLVVRKVDRLVFNVENSIAATGGDATDALKVTPNVRVTEDNVSIVGKGGLLVLVDDREIHLSGADLINYLKSIPSDNIKSIEVITTPPAKYEAQGNSGILNIILKKAKNDSWSLQLRTSTQKAYKWSFTEGATFMLQKNKWSVLTSVQYSPYNTFLYTNDTRYQYPTEYWKTKSFEFYKRKSLWGNASVGYKITDNLQIGVNYNGGGGNRTTDMPVEKNFTKTYENPTMQMLNKMYTMDGMSKKSNYNHSLNFNAVQKLDTLGKKISLDLDYFITGNDEENPFYQNNSFYNPQLPSEYYFTQNNSNLKNTNISTRLDFEMPYKWATLNYGGKISFTKNNSNTFGSFYQIVNNQNNLYLSQDNNFIYKENNQVLYISAQKDFGKKWSAKAGLRFEATQTEGISTPNGAVTSPNKTHYAKLFPTAYLSYKLNDNNTFSASYSRRIDRPSYWMLDPARGYMNLNSIFEGNPFLQPTFINSISLNHQFKSILTSEISYSASSGDNDQIIRHQNDTVYFLYENYANSKNFSISETFNLQIAKWWTTASGASTSLGQTNIFKNLVDEGVFKPKYNNWAGINFYSNNTFNLNKTKTLTAQVNFSANTKSNWGDVWQLSPWWKLDLGLKYALLENKLQLSLYVNDIFFTSDFVLGNTTSGIKKSFHPTNDSRYVRLTVSYKFGNDRISVQSREGSNTEEKRRAGN